MWKARITPKYGKRWLLSDLNGDLSVGVYINHQHYGDVWQLTNGLFLRNNDVAFYLVIPEPPEVTILENLLHTGEEIA